MYSAMTAKSAPRIRSRRPARHLPGGVSAEVPWGQTSGASRCSSRENTRPSPPEDASVHGYDFRSRCIREEFGARGGTGRVSLEKRAGELPWKTYSSLFTDFVKKNVKVASKIPMRYTAPSDGTTWIALPNVACLFLDSADCATPRTPHQNGRMTLVTKLPKSRANSRAVGV